jgi:hypothetical protein
MQMDVDKLNTGEKIAGVSAVLLFIFMFFNWFGVEISGEDGSVSFGSGAGGNACATLPCSWSFALISGLSSDCCISR